MRTCLALLLFALAATTAHAASWSPFVGVGGHAGVVGSYSHGDWPQRWDGTYRGYGASGGMIEAGLATERVDLYVAYRHSEAKSYAFENRVSSYWNEGSFVSMSAQPRNPALDRQPHFPRRPLACRRSRSTAAAARGRGAECRPTRAHAHYLHRNLRKHDAE